MNPYEVLGVTPNATQDEIKKKYRELVKKYHPDKYRTTDKAKFYEEKIKEINEAYDLLTKNSAYGSNSYTGGYENTSQGQGYYTGAYQQQFIRVRQCIQANNLSAAEAILNGIPVQNGEWFFLKGLITLRYGYYDTAQQYFRKAHEQDKSNPEYTAAYNAAERGAYSNFYGRGESSGGLDCCRICSCLLCMDSCCSVNSFC